MAELQSMTGFASAAATIGGAQLVCDIRSVNGRSLDIKLRLPAGLDALETRIRKRAGSRLARGNVQIAVSVDRAGPNQASTIDGPLFRALAVSATALASETGVAPPTADGLLAARGVVVSDDGVTALDPARDADALLGLVDAALDGLVAARVAEGQEMATAIANHLAAIEGLIARAVADPSSQPEAIRARLAQQIERLLGDQDGTALDASRLNAEAAVLATKADIREETDRLSAHVRAGRDLLASGGVIGRKLDFLAQEFNREANTLCAKSASTELTGIGLELKSAIDQMREQVQNLQ